MVNRSFWKDKKVFVTGHTGFKGGWLALWLKDMGAKVYGYALNPSTEPSFYELTDLAKRLDKSVIADIRDYDSLLKAIESSKAEIIFHMAAQPLVRDSYASPVETYATNVMGTVNLLEAARKVPNVRTVVNITTDKCYENKERVGAYTEGEALGGFDPYSSSKACSELVSSAYRSSFFSNEDKLLATARAGNVIGGGDWSKDRLLPDFFRALDLNQALVVRSPDSVRPWQHVLEPLSGYLKLAERLHSEGNGFAEAWNFGPEEYDAQPVRWLLDFLCSNIEGAKWELGEKPTLHEAKLLRLDIDKAKTKLQWKPKWNLETALKKTSEWHFAWKKGENMANYSLSQISSFENGKSHE